MAGAFGEGLLIIIMGALTAVAGFYLVTVLLGWALIIVGRDVRGAAQDAAA